MLIDTSIPDESLTILLNDKNQIDKIYYDAGICKKGDIYAVSVTYIDHNLNAVFVSFGVGKNGFLPLDNIHPMYFNYREKNLSNLSLKQILMVQIEKEEYKTKGPYCTTYIVLTGRYCVLMIDSKIGTQDGISKKIDDSEIRQYLRGILNKLNLPENMNVIFRSVSLEANEKDIYRDLKMLLKIWNKLYKRVLRRIELLYSESKGMYKVLRDYSDISIQEIYVTDKHAQIEAKNVVQTLFAKKMNVMLMGDDEYRVWMDGLIWKYLMNSICEKITLPSGGYINIHPTEALTAIDINSGSKKNDDVKNSIVNTNIEAAKECVKQILERNISGQIVIDFIEMDSPEADMIIEHTVKQGFKYDKARIKLGKLNQFSLMDISRQRIGLSVYDWLTSKCEHCECAGYVMNIDFAAKMHLRYLMMFLKDKQYKQCKVELNGKIVMQIFNKYADILNWIKKMYGMSIVLKECDNHKLDQINVVFK